MTCGTSYSATDLSNCRNVLQPSSILSYNVLERKYANMKQDEWGLYILHGKWAPMQTDKPEEPAELTDIIYCSCKKLCNTKIRTCRQHCLCCSDVCTQNADCRGQALSTRNYTISPMTAWTEAIAQCYPTSMIGIITLLVHHPGTVLVQGPEVLAKHTFSIYFLHFTGMAN